MAQMQELVNTADSHFGFARCSPVGGNM